jgi:hypothetical protein
MDSTYQHTNEHHCFGHFEIHSNIMKSQSYIVGVQHDPTQDCLMKANYVIKKMKFLEGQAHPWVVPLGMSHFDFLRAIEL